MSELPEVLSHGPLERVFPEVYVLKGMIRTSGADPWQFSRNMTVVREGDALTLINSIRLDDGGLAALDALGTVTNLVKLGSYHGRDDAFYLQRHPDALMWAPPRMTHDRAVTTDRELGPGSVPVRDAELFVFETPSNVEAILRLDREGGILIPCDSLQNWEEPDAFFSERTKPQMKNFYGRATFGFGWLKHAKPQASDFERLLRLEFRHLLPSHGTPLLDEAKTAVQETYTRVFG